MGTLKLSSGIVLTDGDRTALNAWLATGNAPADPVPPPVVITPPAKQGPWNDNQRLWVVAATGHPDTELMNRLGYNAYTNGIQDRSTGGTLYASQNGPVLQQQASMAAGANQPPSFTWTSHQAAGEGSVVNGQWVWAPKMYASFAALT